MNPEPRGLTCSEGRLAESQAAAQVSLCGEQGIAGGDGVSRGASPSSPACTCTCACTCACHVHVHVHGHVHVRVHHVCVPPEAPDEQVVAALGRSLERLGLDYLDAYLIHWPGVTRGGYEKYGKYDTWHAYLIHWPHPLY